MLLRGLPQGKISNPFLVDARCRPRQHEIHEKVQKLSACDLVRFEQALEHASLVDSQDQSRDAREVPGNDAGVLAKDVGERALDDGEDPSLPFGIVARHGRMA